jgi:phage baseplate assembly protein V
MIESHLRQQLGSLSRRIALVVGRGILRLVNDAPNCQRLQSEYLRGEVRESMERIQDYGFTSVPHPGQETLALFVGGDRANGVVIAVNDRTYRLNGLQGGEVALYDDLGQKVHLTRDGVTVETPLNVTLSAGKTLRLEAEDIEIHARHSYSLDVDGYGDRFTSVAPGSGTYRSTTWQTGAVVTADPPLPINPPEGP